MIHISSFQIMERGKEEKETYISADACRSAGKSVYSRKSLTTENQQKKHDSQE